MLKAGEGVVDWLDQFEDEIYFRTRKKRGKVEIVLESPRQAVFDAREGSVMVHRPDSSKDDTLRRVRTEGSNRLGPLERELLDAIEKIRFNSTKFISLEVRCVAELKDSEDKVEFV